MALSPIAAKALAKAEASCYILYGSGYFTDEEWTRLDLLLHKGKHVFEDGPSQPESNHVYAPTIKEKVADTRKGTVPSHYAEELLLVFDDVVGEVAENHVHVEAVGSSSQDVGLNNKTTSELELASPLSANSEEPANTFSPVESSGSSASSVTYDVPKGNDSVRSARVDAANTTELQQMSWPDIGLVSTPVSQLNKAPQDGQRPGLPPGVTLEQLELAKSFMGGVAKKYVASPSSQNTPAKKIPTPKKEPERIDWATEVNEAVAQHALPSRPRSVVSSAPSASTGSKVCAGLSSAESSRRIELFTKTFGRPPKALSDYYQPNNPEFNPPWLKASTVVPSPRKGAPSAPTAPAAFHARSPSSPGLNKSVNSVVPQNYIALFKINVGSVYVATQSHDTRSGSGNLAFNAGDKIRISKYVSGNMWRGENLRTKQTGHVQKSHLKELKEDSGNASRAVLQIKPPSIQNLVDDIEETNAAQWESDADVIVPTDRPQLNPKVEGKSNYAEPREASAVTGIKEETRAEVEKLWDEKVSPSASENALTSSASHT
ncbi:hypothetical protein CJF32_00010426 [Rutstroemia sp. NJR-2017a WRK4]|nr:hypothetical protein CJF32_00010426 [Rutstroemia sp. NJR-2017a WRK4]